MVILNLFVVLNQIHVLITVYVIRKQGLNSCLSFFHLILIQNDVLFVSLTLKAS